MNKVERQQFDFAPVQIHNAGFGYHIAREESIRKSLKASDQPPTTASTEKTRVRSIEDVPNWDTIFTKIVDEVHGSRWNVSRLAARIGTTEGRISSQLEKIGIRTDRTGFEVTGPPVAWLILTDTLGNNLPITLHKEAFGVIKSQYENVLEKMYEVKHVTGGGEKNGSRK